MSSTDVISWQYPENPVFHYTSQWGLLGILKDKAIWATDISYLNDAAELDLAGELTRQQVEIAKTTATAEDGKLLEIIGSETAQSMHGGLQAIYICSFSSDGDLLSQWRGYCPPGNGFSLGFRLRDLQAICEKQGFRCAKCLYTEAEQIHIIDRFIGQALDRLRQIRDQTGLKSRGHWETAYNSVRSRFLQIAPVIKHGKFSEEQEWRLISEPISITADRTKYRQGRSTILPYLELKLAPTYDDLLRLYVHVVVGPTAHKGLALQAVQNLFTCMKLPRAGAESSVIPYRAW